MVCGCERAEGWRPDVVVLDLGALHPDPKSMTLRARAYLTITACRHLVIGLFTLFNPEQFSSPVFVPIVSTFPLWAWGAAFVGVALICLVGTLFRSRAWARTGLAASATVTGIAAAGLWLGVIDLWLDHKPVTILTSTLLSALVAKDLTMCAQPMRTPFEDLLWMQVPPVATSGK